MRLSLPISVSLLLLLAWQRACAQLAPAADFFNGGAQFYISNNIPSALEKVEGGLKIYPDDVKLKKLEALLKQQQQSQSSQSQQQQQQNQPSSQKNSQDQQKQDEQKQNQAEQKKDGQEKQQGQQNSAAQNRDSQKTDQNAETQPVAPEQMTPEEAKRLLDAQKGNEQILQMRPQGKPQDGQKPIKDW
jgi:Mg-chelatase subunit ChlI